MTNKKYKEMRDMLATRITEITDHEFRFIGCNGEYFDKNADNEWSFLQSYHSLKEICIYLRGLLAGLS